MALRVYFAILWAFIGSHLGLSQGVWDTNVYSRGELNLLSSSGRHLQQSRGNIDDAVCGEMEYFCGDSDVISSQAYTSTQSSNCSIDSDLQIYICGDVILTAAEYTSLQTSRAGCKTACSLSNVGLVSSSQYYWSVSEWGSCLAACGGSTQDRTVICMNSIDGGQAGADLCDATAKPSLRRQCNAIPCQECSSACGQGLSLRDSYCQDPYGNLADPTGCQAYNSAKLSQDCSNPSCSSTHWSTGSWSACSATCGGGTRIRNVTCQDSTGKMVDDSACGLLTKPKESLACGTQPCVGYTWSVGGWGNCSVSCGGGVQGRAVACVNQQGKPANASLCLGKVPADQLQCSVLPCNFCSQTTCAGQGICKNGVCVCQPGYRGSYCEIPPECSGILDAAGNCCDHGVVDVNGTCCAATAVLDASARCCSSGKRDACGNCDGAAKAVDVQNVCCQSGVLDAGGFCCESAALDECGVCDGDSQSCLLTSEVIVQVPEPASLTSLGLQTSAAAFQLFISKVLEVNSTNVDLSDFTLVPGGRLTAANTPSNMQVQFTISPADSYSTPHDLRASVASSHLQAALGEASDNKLFILSAISSVRRTALCGNQVCEAGERYSLQGPTGCLGDCPFLLQSCPAATSNGSQCSGSGRCLSATGTCLCFLGYAGKDCSLCAEGYIRFGASCARYVKADLPLLDSTSSANVLVVLAIGIALAVLGALFLIIAVVIIIRQRKQLKSLRRSRRQSSWRRPLTGKADTSASAKPETTDSGKETMQASKDVEDGSCSSGSDELSPRLPSLFNPAARVKSVMDVARMHKESLGALRSRSTTSANTQASPRALQPEVQAKPSVFSRRNSGRPRPTPLLRGTTAIPLSDQSPSKASERLAVRRKLKLLRASSGIQRSDPLLQAAQESENSSADAHATITLDIPKKESL